MKILHISESIKGGIATYLTELYEKKSSKHKLYFFLPKNQIEYMSNRLLLIFNFLFILITHILITFLPDLLFLRKVS